MHSALTKSPDQATKKGSNTPFFKGNAVYPKLKIGQPNDQFEQEADAMAEKVVQHVETVEPAHLSEPPPTSSVPPVQQKCAECAKEETVQEKEEEPSENDLDIETKPLFEGGGEPPEDDQQNVQAEGQNGGDDTIGGDFEQSLAASKGSGDSLPAETQSEMESGFGSDFGDVRVHTDSSAQQMSESIQAKAFTNGSDIYFNQGQYSPETSEGKKLLAHELTHTVQQGGGEIQRATTTNPAPSANQPIRLGKIELDTQKKLLKIPSLPLPKFKKRNSGLFSNGIKSKPDRRNAKRKTKEVSLWKNAVKDEVHSKVDTVLKAAEGKGDFIQEKKGSSKIFFLKPKKGSNKFRLIGPKTSIKSEMLLPEFDRSGQPRHHSVDHIVEYQLLNGEDAVGNFELLDFTANISSGGVVKGAWDSSVRKVLDSLKSKVGTTTQIPSFDQVKKNYTVEFSSVSFRKGVSGAPKKHWKKEEIEKGRQLSLLKVMSVKEVEKENLAGSPTELVIFPLKNSGVPVRIPWVSGETVKSVKISNWLPNFTLKEVLFEPTSDDGKTIGAITGDFFEKDKLVETDAPLTLKIKKKTGIGYGGYIDRTDLEASLKQTLKFKPLSPVEIRQATINNKNGIVARGKVLPTIPFMEKADIDIVLDRDGARISKTFTAEELTLPSPFEVSNASLEISVGSKGLRADGAIDFAIEKVGEGTVKGRVDQRGNILLAGEFNIASELFEKSAINFTYQRSAEGESQYSIGGEVSLGAGKVKGLKKASAQVEYSNDKLSAQGTAQPDIKGFEEIEMFLEAEKGNFTFGGKVGLSGIVPKVKQGELELTVTKGEEGYSVNGGGFVIPDIPGLKGDTKLTIQYKDGAITFEGEVPFTLDQANAEGTIKVGITNQVIDENSKPTGEVSDKWTVFGEGSVVISLGKGIEAGAAVILNPNGDIIVAGEVALDTDSEAVNKNKKEFDKTLFKIAPPSVPIFVIPPIGASLVLGIEGGARVYATLIPPHFTELSLGFENFNLTNPDENTAIIGRVGIGMSGVAGAEIYLTLSATLSVLVAKVKGSLTGSLGLEAKGEASAMLEAKWSKAKGLELEKGEIDLNAQAQFLAKLKGGIRVFVDLWLAELDIWEEEIEIANKTFGPKLDVGLKLPIWMENGELKFGEIDEKAIQYPDVSSEEKQMELAEQAVKQDSKFQPPPPPSKAEALSVTRRLGPGEVAWGIVTRKEKGDELFSTKFLADMNAISRDTYVMWLQYQHKTLDWTEVAQVRDKKDWGDYEKLKSKLSTSEKQEDIFGMNPKVWLVQEFKNDHIVFSKRNPNAISELYQLANS